MKMSKKTRIMSVLLCVALMMGVMSVGMMANAANDADAFFTWKAGGYWYTSQGGSATDTTTDGAISIVADKTVSKNMFQTGAWNASTGCFTTDGFATAVDGKTGIAIAVRIDKALASSGDWNPPKLDAAIKLSVSGEGTYSCQYNGIEVGGSKAIAVFPFESFVNENPSGDFVKNAPLAEDSLTKVTNIEFDIVSYASYYGNSFNSLEVTISPFYAYTDEASDIALPGEEQQPSSEEPAPTPAPTEAPTTTVAPTTEAPAPTTTVAPAPTTTAAVKAATPVKVKKVTAKSKAKKKVTVTWKAAKNAKKYVVKYSYKKNMKKAKTVTVKKAKATLKKLKSGKKVYIQVQGVNGSAKGKWSAKKAVKVK